MTARATPDHTPVVGDGFTQARSREAGEVNTNTVSTPPHPVEEAVALTPERIAELRKIAEGAEHSRSMRAEGAFYATFNPAFAMELLAEIERLRAAGGQGD